MDPVNGALTLHSREAPHGLVVADFNADGSGDIVVTHSGGSGALPGFVDVIPEMRRVKPKDRSNRQRELTAYSRFEETLAELVIELAEDGSGYDSLGSPSEVNRQDRWESIRDLLPGYEPGQTADELLAAWPEEARKPGLRTLREDLIQGVRLGRWRVTGA